MGQKLYLECYSGISGDMTVAALSGLMKDRTPLFCVLDHMPVEGFSYELKQVKKSGIDAWDFLVKLDAEHENHDHDMEYLHGHSHTHDHDHHHGHEGHHHADEVFTQKQQNIIMIRCRRKRCMRRKKLDMRSITIIITNIADWEIFSRSLTGVI